MACSAEVACLPALGRAAEPRFPAPPSSPNFTPRGIRFPPYWLPKMHQMQQAGNTLLGRRFPDSFGSFLSCRATLAPKSGTALRERRRKCSHAAAGLESLWPDPRSL